MSVRGRPKSGEFLRPTTPAIGPVRIERLYRQNAVKGSARLFEKITKYHIRQGRKQWEIFQ
jgi:hypothetical protein